MVAGALIGVGVAVIFALISISAVQQRKARAYTEENGEPAVGWLVQANNALFQAGSTDLPALVLVSPDDDTAEDEEYMTELADDVFALKGQDCEDEDEAFVSALVTDERYVAGKRTKLPKSFAGRPNVYLAHIFIFREHLPKGRLSGRMVKCQIVWDEPGTLICTRPMKGRKKSRRDEDEDED